MKVTYLGTTTLLFDDGDDQILFDAHITRPSIPKFLFSRLETDRMLADELIDLFQIRRLRAVFISHSHYDHVMDAPYFAETCHADLYGSSSALNVARGGGVPEERLHDYRESSVFEIGKFRITIIKSIHSKAHWYNNDLGQTIDEPLMQPAKKKLYKEGGSYDFLIEHEGRHYLIRPSFNYIKGQLDGIHADVLFLGVAGITKFSEREKRVFFSETIEKVRPDMVIPVHWDNFLVSLRKSVRGMPSFIEKTEDVMHELAKYCGEHDIHCAVQIPLTSMEC